MWPHGGEKGGNEVSAEGKGVVVGLTMSNNAWVINRRKDELPVRVVKHENNNGQSASAR